MMLKFLILLLGGFLVLPHVTLGNQKVIMKIESSEKFPFYFNTPFKVKLVPNSPNGTISVNSDFASLEIRIADKTGFEFERQQILYRSESKVYRGDFFTILSWRRNVNKNYLELILLFPMVASNKSLEIYEISAANEAEYFEIKENSKLARLLYKSKIILSLLQKVELSLSTLHGKRDKFLSGETVTVKCQSSGFSILSRPNIVNLNEFTVNSEIYTEIENEINVKIKLQSSDHGKTLKCQAGKVQEIFLIKVIHAPSKVKISTNFNSVVKINSSISCDPENGYPIPNTSWTLIKGPNTPSVLYLIDKSKRNITFIRSSLGDLEWIFNCSARYKLNNVSGIYHKSVKFMNEGGKIKIYDMDNIEKMIIIEVSKMKMYVDGHLNNMSNNLNFLLKENAKMAQTNKNLLKEISMMKNIMKTYSENVKELKENIKYEIDKMNITNKKLLSKSEMSKTPNSVGTEMEFQKLKEDVIKQNDEISGLKLKTETMKLDMSINNMLTKAVNRDIKALAQSTKVLQSQMVFAKLHLYWLTPISWSVTGIDVDESTGKKEATSDPFYTEIANYKLHLYASFTVKKIEYFIYLYDNRRNKHNNKPFKGEITITVIHSLLPNIKLQRKISSIINTTPGISEAISFTREELSKYGFLDGNMITITCDVQEM